MKCDLKGNFVIFYMLAKYVPGDIKYIFTKFYRHISTNNEANCKFVILISIYLAWFSYQLKRQKWFKKNLSYKYLPK
jgi:ABC-type molybdate transport system permease subunit